MSRAVGPLVVTERGRTLRVRGRAAGRFLRSYGLRPAYLAGAWVIDGRHGPDLAAWCDYESIRCRWESAA